MTRALAQQRSPASRSRRAFAHSHEEGCAVGEPALLLDAGDHTLPLAADDVHDVKLLGTKVTLRTRHKTAQHCQCTWCVMNCAAAGLVAQKLRPSWCLLLLLPVEPLPCQVQAPVRATPLTLHCCCKQQPLWAHLHQEVSLIIPVIQKHLNCCTATKQPSANTTTERHYSLWHGGWVCADRRQTPSCCCLCQGGKETAGCGRDVVESCLHGLRLNVAGRTVATRTLSAALLISQEPRREGTFFCMCRTGVLYASSSWRLSEKLMLAATRLKNGRPCTSVMVKLSFLNTPSCSCIISTVCCAKQKRASTTAGRRRRGCGSAGRGRDVKIQPEVQR